MKRLFAMILALAMVLSMVPPTALQVRAEEVTPPEETVTATTAPAETVAPTAPAEAVTEPVPETEQETAPAETVPETVPAQTTPAETVPETVPATEPAQTVPAELASDTEENKCGENVYWSLEDGVLTIWGEGKMEDYDVSTGPWHSSASSITSIAIEVGVTHIGSLAFMDLANLRSVSLPDGLLSIGENAFFLCANLASITIPRSVAHIGEGAFYGCSSLNGIWVDNENEVYCNDESGVLFTKNMERIVHAPGAITGVYEIPSSVTQIDNYAFISCAGLAGITMPDSLNSIGTYAFGNCSSLTNVIIPDSVITIGESAFESCSNLSSITVPDGVTKIGRDAFRFCSALESFDIPDSITSLEPLVLCECTSLTSIDIPSNITSIGASAFWGCSKLKEIRFEGDAPEINTYAFSYVEATAYYPEDAIGWADVMTQELLYSTITWVSYDNVPVETEPEDGGSITWSLEDGMLTISGTGDMDSSPWEDQCEAITSVVIEDGVTSIAVSAFDGCSNLTSVEIPDSVTSIGVSAFCDCSSLASIKIPNGVTYIYESTFNGCSSLTGIEIPGSVTFIDMFAFSYCSGLTNVTIPDSVRTINSFAFSDCTGLASVTIGDGVTLISTSAFYDCSGLTEITFRGDAPEMHDDVFYGVTATAYYPAGNATWTSDVMQDYGGNITWVCYGEAEPPAEMEQILLDQSFDVSLDPGKSLVYSFTPAEDGTYILHGNEADYIFMGVRSASTNEQIAGDSWSDSTGSDTGMAFALTGGETYTIELSHHREYTISTSLTMVKAGNYETLEMFVGSTTAYVGASFDLAVATGPEFASELITWSVTDENIVELDYSHSNFAWFIPKAPGTTTITATASRSGLTTTCTVTVKEMSAIEGNSVTVTLPANDGVTYLYTPEEDGTYLFYLDGSIWNVGINVSEKETGNWVLSGDWEDPQTGDHGCFVTLTGGKEYTVELFNSESTQMEITVSIVKTLPYENAWIEGSNSCCVGDVVQLWVSGTPAMALESVTWASSNPAVAEIGSRSASAAWVTAYSVGTTIITAATESGLEMEFELTVTETAPETEPVETGPEDGGSITWSLEDGVLTIWGEGEMENWADAYDLWRERADEITSIVVESGITRISSQAFTGLPAVTSVTLPDGLESIAYNAFRFCESLTFIDIPETVTSLGDYAFSSTGLTSVTIPAGVTEIANGLFYNSESLQSVTIEGHVTSIGDHAFAQCDLRSFTFPATVTYIGYEALRFNLELTSVSEIPATVSFIDGNIFDTCYKLTSIEVADDNPYYCDIDGVLFNKAVTELIAFPAALEGSYTVPSSVTTIGADAFIHADVEQITLPEGLTTIGDGAFTSCAIESISIPASVSSIGHNAFDNSYVLTAIEVAEGNPNYCDIDGVLFNKAATKLITLPAQHSKVYTVPSSVTTLGSSCFPDTDFLLGVTIPASVTQLEEGAFDWFEGRVVFEGNAPALPNGLLEDAFRWCAITAYYPEDATGWADVICQEPWNGSIEWIPYGEEGVPALSNISKDTAVEFELEEPIFVEAAEPGYKKYYTFTAHEDGYYVIYTAGESCPGFAVYELDENGHWAESSPWSNCSYVDGSLHLMPMSAGKTYGLELHYYGGQSDCYLAVEQSNLAKVEVADIQIYEYTNGTCYDDGYFYELDDLLRYTVHYDDGTQKTGTIYDEYGNHIGFTWIWKGHELTFGGYGESEQSPANRWTAGNTYTCYYTFLGSTHPVQVQILEGPEDITIELEDVVIPADNYGYPNGFKYYWVEDYLNGTITINGTTCNIYNSYFTYDEDPTDDEPGRHYRLWVRDGQGPGSEWEAGDHEVTVGIMGVEMPVTVTIYDPWLYAQALEPDVTVYVGNMEYEKGHTFTFTPEEDGYYMFRIFNTGDCKPSTQFYRQTEGGQWIWEGFDNGWYDDGVDGVYARLMYMSAGTTYGLICTNDCSPNPITCNLNVVKTDIADVSLSSDVNIYEYTHGYWEGYQGYWGETDGYYHYSDLLDRISYTVTYADGTQETGNVNNCTLKVNRIQTNWGWDGWGGDEQGEPWTAENSYELYIDFLGKQHSTQVHILPTPENVTLNLDPVTASYEDFDWYYENFGDGEEIEWKAYNWSRYINGTITIDEETYTIRNGRFYFPAAGYTCQLWTRDAQAWDNLWELDGTYTGTAGTLGVSAECAVTIADIGRVNEWILEIIGKAPALSEMTPMTSDILCPVTIENNGDIQWFTFTPEEDGTYSFFSQNDGSPALSDPYAFLFDSNFTYLAQGDDSGSVHFQIARKLAAGETYLLAVAIYGENQATFQVGVKKALTVSEIRIDPISIPADAWCYPERIADAFGNEMFGCYYDWRECLKGKLIFSDGNFVAFDHTSVELDGVTYELETYDEQDFDWVAGNSYPVSVSCQGVTVETTVTITNPSIKSISIKPITMQENEYNDYGYDWPNSLFWTVTFKDGKKLSGEGSSFTYKNNHYSIGYFDNQYENPFVGGNTYTVYAVVGPHTVPVSLTIKDVDYTLPAVDGLTIKSVKPTSIQIGFDKQEGAVKYEFYLNGAYHGSTTKTNYTFTGLTAGVYYELGVAAVYKVDEKTVSGPTDSVMAKAYTDISKFTLALEYTSVAYDGTEKTPEITLKNGKTVIPSVCYHYGFMRNVEVGQALIFVAGQGIYGGMMLKSFKIVPAQVTGLEVTELTENSATITFDPVHGADEYWIYNGKNLVAKVTDTTYTFEDLKAGTNYSFSVKANAIVEEFVLDGYDFNNPSEPETRIADYTGEAATVSTKPTYEMDGFVVQLSKVPAVYTGKKLTPAVTVFNDSGKKLKNKTDYAVTYSDNVDVGTATVTVTGNGKYSGTIVTTFDIVPPKPKSAKVTALSGTSAELTIREVKAAQWYDIYVDDQYIGRTSELTYVAEDLPTGRNIKFYVRAGVTIDGKDYIGEMSPPAPVVLKHNMNICSVTLEQTELVYTGKKLQPEVTVTGHKGAVLTKGVDYNVTYKNNSATGIATVTVTGKGSYSGTATAEFTIVPAAVTNLAVKSTTTTSVTVSFTKTGSAKYYNVYVDGVYHGRTTGGTYKISGLEVGDIHDVYVVSEKTVKKVTYQSEACEAIQVWAGTDIAKFKVTPEYSRATYEGVPLCPTVVVKTSAKKNAATLVEGTDYIIEYVGNNNPGKAKIVVKGIGQYAGVVTKTFTIFMKNPTGVTVTALDPNTIHVEFDAVPGATKYQVLVGGKVKATITEGTACDITGLKKNTTYSIKVKAVYTSGTYTQNTTSTAVKIKTPSA